MGRTNLHGLRSSLLTSLHRSISFSGHMWIRNWNLLLPHDLGKYITWKGVIIIIRKQREKCQPNIVCLFSNKQKRSVVFSSSHTRENSAAAQSFCLCTHGRGHESVQTSTDDNEDNTFLKSRQADMEEHGSELTKEDCQ